MTPLEPAIAAIALAAAFGLGALVGPSLTRWITEVDRRQAIRLHAQGWTHGQIAEQQDRDPRQIAEWLAEADRSRTS
ncbi:MAG: helix-turn-helix domain-containing protein [Brevundimonas sp.]|uniref:helix-turn-helix domain-containing protein n=1 Tax=Brevundimonas sp. TaxID=1871086 RepID=UPI00272901B4|nr:helix-turn-helix domain-containing protein [Brevundimonas sp.]MDO9607250.1 helix-turn-helix domain-containing protein [Brevundimonas sp.]